MKQAEPKAVSKSKATVANAVKTTGRIVNNAETLVVTVALVILVGNQFNQLHTITNRAWYLTIAACVVLVGFFSLSLLVKFLNKGDN